MSEEADTSTSTTAPVTVAAPPTSERPRHSRVAQVAAWVGIVAGVTFVVAVIFFSGFILGKHSDGGGHHRGGPDRPSIMFHRGGPPHMFPGGPGGEGGPGFGPGFQSPQGQSPGPGNSTTTPARP